MRAVALFLCGCVVACGGDDSTGDASSDATLDAPGDADVADVAVDAPPERAIWVASATTLYKFDPVTRVVTRVADFDCSGEEMLDLAMNAKEELFGITTESVVRIDKTTGACTALARGSQDLPYATAFVPGTEKWAGYKIGVYDTIDPDSGALTFAGALTNDAGIVFRASGDMVSLAGGKTYVTLFDLDPNAGDGIAEVDPNDGALLRFDGTTGLSPLLGLAQWAGVLYVFSNEGHVYSAQVTDAGVNLKPLIITYYLGDAGPPDAASDASADADADAEAGPPPSLPILFRGAAVTTRAPTQ